MNKDESSDILAILKGVYPVSYKDMHPADIEMLIDLWANILEEYQYPEVEKAVKAIIKVNTTNFAPSPGAVIERILKNRTGPQMSEMEAWNVVFRAIKNSAWHSGEEFLKLPHQIRRCVGSPEMLKSWAELPADTVNSVIQSNFIKSFRGFSADEFRQQAIGSSSADEMIKKLAEGLGA